MFFCKDCQLIPVQPRYSGTVCRYGLRNFTAEEPFYVSQPRSVKVSLHFRWFLMISTFWPWVSNMRCKGRPRRCKIPSGFYRMVCHNVIAHNLMLIVCCQGLLLPDGWPYGARDFLEAGISTRSWMPGRWWRSVQHEALDYLNHHISRWCHGWGYCCFCGAAWWRDSEQDANTRGPSKFARNC